jgi:hypothetical protein
MKYIIDNYLKFHLDQKPISFLLSSGITGALFFFSFFLGGDNLQFLLQSSIREIRGLGSVEGGC